MTNEKTDGGTSLTEDASVSVSASESASHAAPSWRVAGKNHQVKLGGFHVVADQRDVPIAYVAYASDAQLIASAPELLEVAKASISVIQLMQEWARRVSDQYLDSDPECRVDYAADIQSATEAIRIYSALIAKAENRS